jgi:hypothetical protein
VYESRTIDSFQWLCVCITSKRLNGTYKVPLISGMCMQIETSTACNYTGYLACVCELKHGKDWCIVCESSVGTQEMQTHKALKRHMACMNVARDGFKVITERGDTFWRDGMELKGGKLECGCGKSVAWWVAR